jgi:hypothetical protein
VQPTGRKPFAVGCTHPTMTRSLPREVYRVPRRSTTALLRHPAQLFQPDFQTNDDL